MNTVLALDFGTSSLKAGLIDSNGVLLWQGGSVFPQVPNYENWQTNQWLYALQRVFTDFNSAKNSLSLSEPSALVISGNGPTLVALGKNYENLRSASWPVLLWMTSEDLRNEGERSFYLPKLAWLRENNRELFDRSHKFMSGPEYLAWTLCGVESTIIPQKDFEAFIWDDGGLSSYGFAGSLFPDNIGVGEIIGRIDALGSENSGLSPGIPVIAGGSDFMMSLLGTGVIEPGLTCDRAGTSEGINYCSPVSVDNDALRCLPHLVPGMYNVAGILSGTGRMFEWFRTFSRQRDISYAQMMERINAASGSRMSPWFFPSVHFDSRWDFKGGMFADLQPEHSSAELGRAVVQAIGFSIRSSIEYLEQSGCTINAMRSCGGQAKNPQWCQMKANLSDVVIEVPEIADAELTGCAMLGFIGLGEYNNYSESVESMLRISTTYEPMSEHRERYRELFIAWDEAYAYIQRAATHLPHVAKEK